VSRAVKRASVKGTKEKEWSMSRLLERFRVKHYTKEFDMAEPKDLQEAADAIHKVRSLAAVQRHKELDDPLRQAEEWARKEYRKVREENGGRDAVKPGSERPE
jgi:hypothetical protein